MIIIVWIQIKIISIKHCKNKKLQSHVITIVLWLYRLDVLLISINKVS